MKSYFKQNKWLNPPGGSSSDYQYNMGANGKTGGIKEAEDNRPSETIAFEKSKQDKKVSPLTSSTVLGSSRIGKSSISDATPQTTVQALGSIYDLLAKIQSYEKLQSELDLVDYQLAYIEEQDRNKKIIEALGGRKPKKKKVKEEKKEKESEKVIEKEKAKPETKAPPEKITEAPKPSATKAPKEVPKPTPKAEPVPAPKPTTAAPSAPRAPVTASKGITGQVAANAGVIAGLTSGLVAAGITNSYAQTAIMANVGKESGFKLESENMNYTTVDRLKKVFPSKFGKMSDEEASQYIKNPEKLGNFIYGGQYGNKEPEDGFKYRGRGSIGLTFRGQYESTAKEIGVPELATNPDLANDPEVNRKIVANYMIKNVGLKKLNEFTDQQTANRVITQAVGGKRLNLDVGIGAELLSKVDAYSSALSGDKINLASTENKNLKADAAANQDKPSITVNNNKTTTTGSSPSGSSNESDDTNAYQRKLKG
jgi:predicted chitinase